MRSGVWNTEYFCLCTKSLSKTIFDRLFKENKHNYLIYWSGREDLNLRPPPPQGGALPGCATPRDLTERDRATGVARVRYDTRELLRFKVKGGNLFVSLVLQYREHFYMLATQLANQLLTLTTVSLGLVARLTLPRPSDGEAVFVYQASYLAHHHHVVMLIIPAIAAPLHRLELRKFLLPITQHMRFHRAEIADLTDGEIALAWYRGQLIIVRCFQHRLLPAQTKNDPGGTSPPAEP